MNDDDMMSPEAEEATGKEWIAAMTEIRKYRKGESKSPAGIIGAVYDYGWACYQAGCRETGTVHPQSSMMVVDGESGVAKIYKSQKVQNGILMGSNDEITWEHVARVCDKTARIQNDSNR